MPFDLAAYAQIGVVAEFTRAETVKRQRPEQNNQMDVVS